MRRVLSQDTVQNELRFHQVFYKGGQFLGALDQLSLTPEEILADLLIMLGIGSRCLYQDVELSLGLKHLSRLFSVMLLHPPHQTVACRIEELESRQDFAEVRFCLAKHLLDSFIGIEGEDGDVRSGGTARAEDGNTSDDPY